VVRIIPKTIGPIGITIRETPGRSRFQEFSLAWRRFFIMDSIRLLMLLETTGVRCGRRDYPHS